MNISNALAYFTCLRRESETADRLAIMTISAVKRGLTEPLSAYNRVKTASLLQTRVLEAYSYYLSLKGE